MGSYYCCICCNTIGKNDEETSFYGDPAELNFFRFPKISYNIFEDVAKKIQIMTGFNPYIQRKIKLNEIQKEIKGTYF